MIVSLFLYCGCAHQAARVAAAATSSFTGLRSTPLPDTDAAVIVAGVARDMRERGLARNAAAGLADDDGHLAFVVEALGLQRPDHRLAAADLAVGKAREDHRVRRSGMATLGEMCGV